jgi:hypothetical protein
MHAQDIKAKLEDYDELMYQAQAEELSESDLDSLDSVTYDLQEQVESEDLDSIDALRQKYVS